MWFDGNQSSRTRKLLQPRLPRCHCRSRRTKRAGSRPGISECPYSGGKPPHLTFGHLECIGFGIFLLERQAEVSHRNLQGTSPVCLGVLRIPREQLHIHNFHGSLRQRCHIGRHGDRPPAPHSGRCDQTTDHYKRFWLSSGCMISTINARYGSMRGFLSATRLAGEECDFVSFGISIGCATKRGSSPCLLDRAA